MVNGPGFAGAFEVAAWSTIICELTFENEVNLDEDHNAWGSTHVGFDLIKAGVSLTGREWVDPLALVARHDLQSDGKGWSREFSLEECEAIIGPLPGRGQRDLRGRYRFHHEIHQYDRSSTIISLAVGGGNPIVKTKLIVYPSDLPDPEKNGALRLHPRSAYWFDVVYTLMTDTRRTKRLERAQINPVAMKLMAPDFMPPDALEVAHRLSLKQINQDESNSLWWQGPVTYEDILALTGPLSAKGHTRHIGRTPYSLFTAFERGEAEIQSLVGNAVWFL
jgi:hypothetical protein